MQKTLQYRQEAAQCRRLAAQMDREEHRIQLLRMAETWEAMADQREAQLSESRSFGDAKP